MSGVLVPVTPARFRPAFSGRCETFSGGCESRQRQDSEGKCQLRPPDETGKAGARLRKDRGSPAFRSESV